LHNIYYKCNNKYQFFTHINMYNILHTCEEVETIGDTDTDLYNNNDIMQSEKEKDNIKK